VDTKTTDALKLADVLECDDVELPRQNDVELLANLGVVQQRQTARLLDLRHSLLLLAIKLAFSDGIHLVKRAFLLTLPA